MRQPFACQTPPKGYRLKMRIDLMRNRGHLKRVVWLSLAVVLACILGGWMLVISPAALLDGGFWMLLARIVVLAAGLIIYLAGHEAVHGILMWLFSRQKPRFGFKLLYAYAGSTACFAKWPYLCIALAPVALWGTLLFWLVLRVPQSWFWVVWGWQITNLSGAAGDIYVACRILPLSSTIVIRDSGAAMMIYDQP